MLSCFNCDHLQVETPCKISISETRIMILKLQSGIVFLLLTSPFHNDQTSNASEVTLRKNLA